MGMSVRVSVGMLMFMSVLGAPVGMFVSVNVFMFMGVLVIVIFCHG
jgi:hypothetical protein